MTLLGGVVNRMIHFFFHNANLSDLIQNVPWRWKAERNR